MTKATIVFSDPLHPGYSTLVGWAGRQTIADIAMVHNPADAAGGDFLFLLSCTQIVGRDIRQGYRHSLVLHASDLPEGRGWSPAIWALVGGETEICMTMLEAEDRVDSGRIWAKQRIMIDPADLHAEINRKLMDCQIAMIEQAMAQADTIIPQAQDEAAATYLRRRTPQDSRIDPYRSLAEQFDLLRVCDPVRYPAFFNLRGRRFKLLVEHMDDPDDR